MTGQNDTIAAIATPQGQGGIGIVRISGPQSRTLAGQITGTTPRSRRVQVCVFRDRDGAAIDNGILLYFPAPASYTGEDVVELHGHGGQVVMSMLLRRVLECGARQAHPGEFTERAYLNDKLDLLQAEAVADLISSRSERAARNAMHTLEGEFSQHVNTLLQRLVDLRVHVEGLLDFPEEETGDCLPGVLEERYREILLAIERLLQQSRNGRLYTQGMKITILGQPNTGKSTLMNRLAGVDRAIVTATPGTTRDIIEQDILIADIPFQLTDTAGIRVTDDAIESEGINRAIQSASAADIVLLVVDCTQDGGSNPVIDATINPLGCPLVHVYNKIDLIEETARANEDSIYLSAKTGAGLSLLKQAIISRVAGQESGDTQFAARQRHINVLLDVSGQLQQAWQTFNKDAATELLADNLALAQRTLATITGQFAADDLLGEIFSRFCIGK